MISWSVTSPILILGILIYYIIDVAVSSFSLRHKFEDSISKFYSGKSANVPEVVVENWRLADK